MDKLGGLWSNLNVSSKGFLIWGAISQGLGISWSPELSRAESGFSAFTLCTSHSVHIRPRQLGRPRYLVLEGRDNPRCKVVLASFNGSPRDILGARDNFVHCLYMLHGYLAPLPETSWGQFFSCEPGTVSSSLSPEISLPLNITRLMWTGP